MVRFELALQSLEQSKHVLADLAIPAGKLHIVYDFPLTFDTLAALLDVLLREHEQIITQQHSILQRQAVSENVGTY